MPVIQEILDEQINKLKDVLDMENTYAKRLFTGELQKKVALGLLMDTGCRISELLRIRPQDIEKKTIKDDGGVEHECFFCRIHCSKSKTNNPTIRWITISPYTRQAIRAYMEMLGKEMDSGRYPFVWVDSRTVQRWVADIRRKLVEKGHNVKTLHPHDFRSLAITRLLMNKWDAAVVSKWSGHKSTATVKTYLSVHEEEMFEITRGTFGF